MKTLEELAAILPSDIKIRFLYNASDKKFESYESLSQALLNSFNWETSPEKLFFWEEVYNLACSGYYEQLYESENDI